MSTSTQLLNFLLWLKAVCTSCREKFTLQHYMREKNVNEQKWNSWGSKASEKRKQKASQVPAAYGSLCKTRWPDSNAFFAKTPLPLFGTCPKVISKLFKKESIDGMDVLCVSRHKWRQKVTEMSPVGVEACLMGLIFGKTDFWHPWFATSPPCAHHNLQIFFWY